MPFTFLVDITEYITAALNTNGRKTAGAVQELTADFPTGALAANGELSPPSDYPRHDRAKLSHQTKQSLVLRGVGTGVR
jgi:hypothetical protein